MLLALALKEQAAEGWGEWATVIPPAPASLAWMTTEVEHLAVQCPPMADAQAAQEPEVEPLPLLTTEVGLFAPSKARVQFGDARNHQRHPQAQPSQASQLDVEVRQLPLF